MKKVIASLLLGFLFCTAAQAQSNATWKEMEDFHTIMAATFHPAEEGDLQPVKTRSKELVEKAVAWSRSSVPQGYDAAKTTATLKQLVKGAKEVDKLVKAGASDSKLVTKLTALHDVFHEIMEKCRKDDHH